MYKINTTVIKIQQNLGIRQTQVDRGVPLGTCLMLCMKWIEKHTTKLNISFPNNTNTTENFKKCMFVTWTDWDLGVCLVNECKRKNVRLPSVFRQWANLKALYKVRKYFWYHTIAV